MVFVALDGERRPTAVPKFEPATAEERELSNYAQEMMKMREGIEAARRKFLQKTA